MNSKTGLIFIGGSDNLCAAGIQQDLKVATAMGVHCHTVVTVLTAQNNESVEGSVATDGELFKQQLATIPQYSRYVVKLGLITTEEQLKVLSDWLAQLKSRTYFIYDPIQISSSGSSFRSSLTINSIMENLAPFIDLITPNLNEWDAATDSLKAAGIAKESLYGLKKGGHGAGEQLIDELHDLSVGSIVFKLTSDKLDGQPRGTGCFYGATIASAMVKGYDLKDSIVLAKSYLTDSISNSKDVSGMDKDTQSTDYKFSILPSLQLPTETESYPFIAIENQKFNTNSEEGFARIENTLGLYPVVDQVEWIERLGELGVKTIQLRIKNVSESEKIEQIKAAVALQKTYDLQLFINDYWELAIEFGAYGVHLGQEDLIEADLHIIQKSGIRLGVSTHGDYEFIASLQLKPSYVAVGAIYPTQTKDMSRQLQGVERLTRYVKVANSLSMPIPVVAIGGINHSNLDEVLTARPHSIAMVSAITKSPNLEEDVAYFQSKIKKVSGFKL